MSATKSPGDGAVVPVQSAPAAHGSGEDPAAPMSMGGLIKASVVRGINPEAKRVALEWLALCTADTDKAVFAAVDATLEIAGISGGVSAEDVKGNPEAFLERLPEWVREKNLDLSLNFGFSTVGGRPGKKAAFYWERFWAVGLGCQNVDDMIGHQILDLLERWILPMSLHGIRTLRHAATVAALAIAQALGHHLRELQKQLDINTRQREDVGAASSGKKKQASKLDGESQLLEERVKSLGEKRQRLLENTIPFRNRDLCEQIRLHSLGEVDQLMKKEPSMFLQQKWTARVFLMIHDQCPEVRLKALSCIASWFEKLRHFSNEVKDHLLQFAERCMLHIVDRAVDTDVRVASKAIQMLRLPVLAERMTDEEVEKIVNLVACGSELEVRQEAALFINSQVFQDPGICTPEQRGRKRKKKATAARDRTDRAEEGAMSEMSDGGDGDEDREAEGREAPDNIAELLNAETSISMFIEYLENYMGDKLRLTERPVNAFWGKAPCLENWATMVSLMILGESNKGPGLDPVSTRQRLILLHVMEAAVRRATEDVKKATQAGVRDKEADDKMSRACNAIVPELPRLFELCNPEDKQVLILSHICKMLIDHAESRGLKDVIWNGRPLATVLKQCILNRGFTDVVKHCTDSLLVISVFVTEVRQQFIDVAKSVHSDTVSAATRMCDGDESQSAEELRMLLGKFDVINQRGIDMSFGSHDCLDVFFKLLDVRVANMRKWRADEGFQFPAGMPDTGHVIYLVENCVMIATWYFRFCHWEHHDPGSTAVQDLDSQQAARIQQTRAVLPKVFLTLRNQLCALMETDGSPHVRLLVFMSYLTIMQVAVGVSEGIDVEGGKAPSLPPGQIIKNPEDLHRLQMPIVPPEHQEVIFKYLNDLFSQVQAAHTVPFDEEGMKVEPHDMWPPLSLRGQHTSTRYIYQELMEGRADVVKANNFEAEDGDRAPQLQILRAVWAARMVYESEIEDLHAGPIGQLVLTQIDRSKPRPLREVALRLTRKLRDLARINTEFAEQYFEAQKSAVVGLYDQAGADAAKSLAIEFARQWGPRIMPWLEKPLHDTLLNAVAECGQMGELGLPLLEAFSFWIKGEEFVTEARRKVLKEKAKQAFEADDIDTSAESAKGLQRFISRCDLVHIPLAVPAPAPAPPAAEAEVPPAGTPGKRLRGKQTVS